MPGKIYEKKSTRKVLISNIPENGLKTSLLMKLLINLAKTGVLSEDIAEIKKIVKIILKAKIDRDVGKQWPGDIELAENFKLTRYHTQFMFYKNRDLP